MKWKTHIVVVGNKCETLWEGDTSAFFVSRRHFDFVKARSGLQSVLSVSVRHLHSKTFRCHNNKQSGLETSLDIGV